MSTSSNATILADHAIAADEAQLTDVAKLLQAYYDERPDVGVPAERVSFGTSGHRGSSFHRSFNENHILAVTQAICQYRQKENITGPLFLGFDTHALSRPAFETALEVLAAHDVQVMIAADGGFTPTPVISHAIIAYNRSHRGPLADGIVITPSHNPPEDGGFKYNPPHGGPAGTQITAWIEAMANELLGAKDIKRMPFAQAQRAASTIVYDFVGTYVEDLATIIDMDAISQSKLHLGVDALGGAGIQYWPRIAERYKLDLTVMNGQADPTFRFMSRDWDGKIRMDPSSPDAMKNLIGLKESFDLAFGCDTDHDRHGIVTKSAGLMASNHYLAVAADYLVTHRPHWKTDLQIGKTVVSSSIIDRAAAAHGRRVYETPVGFKWFVDGLTSGALCFAGEESAGATFLDREGQTWTTDKDGLIAGLLAAEMTARTGNDPGVLYKAITQEVGSAFYRRSDAPATKPERTALAKLSAENCKVTKLGGEAVTQVMTQAPGDGAAIGGIKVVAPNGWFAARPSGTEDISKIYCESFVSEAHLAEIEQEARAIVKQALAAAGAIG
jgi:phosphoglucomutase